MNWKGSVFIGIVFAFLGFLEFPSSLGLALVIGAGLWFKIASLEKRMSK